MDVTIPYTPRKQQAFIHKELDKKRFSVLCCHRRFGKTVMLINHLIKCCMTNQNHAPRFAYIAPTYSQAKKIAWDYLKFYTKVCRKQSITKLSCVQIFLMVREYNCCLLKIQIAFVAYILMVLSVTRRQIK